MSGHDRMMRESTEWGPWLDWDGSAEMPPGVCGDCSVSVQFRGDYQQDDNADGAYWVWLHAGTLSDIVRYRLRADHPVYGKVETVRVRIAVVVDDSGFWRAVGELGQIDADAVADATGHWDNDGPLSVSWVEAEVPVPEAVTVQGEVAND